MTKTILKHPKNGLDLAKITLNLVNCVKPRDRKISLDSEGQIIFEYRKINLNYRQSIQTQVSAAKNTVSLPLDY